MNGDEIGSYPVCQAWLPSEVPYVAAHEMT